MIYKQFNWANFEAITSCIFVTWHINKRKLLQYDDVLLTLYIYLKSTGFCQLCDDMRPNLSVVDANYHEIWHLFHTTHVLQTNIYWIASHLNQPQRINFWHFTNHYFWSKFQFLHCNRIIPYIYDKIKKSTF